MSASWYLLDSAGSPVSVPRSPAGGGMTPGEWDAMEWLWGPEGFEHRLVARAEIGTTVVSTVFLGAVDGAADAAAPLLWETEVLLPDQLVVAERYSSLREARAGHRRVARRERARQARGGA